MKHKFAILTLVSIILLLMLYISYNEVRYEKAIETLLKAESAYKTITQPYTIIKDNGGWLYVSEYHIEGDRVHYTKLDGQAGNMPLNWVELEQGHIPTEQLQYFGAWSIFEGGNE